MSHGGGSSVELALASIADLPDECERQASPEHALMLEQLEQGLRYAAKGDKEDLRWLMSDDRSHLHAFAVLAEIFDLDAGRIRAGIQDQLRGARALCTGRVQRLGARTKVVEA